MRSVPALTTDQAFERYEALRDRLPVATYPSQALQGESLQATKDYFDGYVLDAFGVLNVGETAIKGAIERMQKFRASGKKLIVLTNAASYTVDVAAERYARFGFDFTTEEIVSSRAVTARHLHNTAPKAHWAAISAEGDTYDDLPVEADDLLENESLWADADAFLFLSSARWDETLQSRLLAALTERPRPVVIANPDLVAPREDGLSIEPGFWGHDIADRTGLRPEFYGKPYGNAFEVARERLGNGRFAMVGDTLHTDILGGRAAGLGAILIARHGMFAGHDVRDYVQRSGIIPDWIVETT